MRTRRAILVVAALLAPVPAGQAAAQTCYGGARAPACRGLVVTELGYLYRLNGAPGLDGGAPQRHYLVGEVGYLRNGAGRVALGGTLVAGALVDYAFSLRYGVAGRVRYWLGPHTSIEGGAGPIFGRVVRGSLPDQVERTEMGLMARVALNANDRVGLLAGVETLRNTTDHAPSWWIGARFGSRPAAWAGGIAAVVLGLGAVLFAQ